MVSNRIWLPCGHHMVHPCLFEVPNGEANGPLPYVSNKSCRATGAVLWEELRAYRLRRSRGRIEMVMGCVPRLVGAANPTGRVARTGGKRIAGNVQSETVNGPYLRQISSDRLQIFRVDSWGLGAPFQRVKLEKSLHGCSTCPVAFSV